MATALISNVLDKLTNVLGQQLIQHEGASIELERLSDTFRSILDLLPEVEGRQFSNENARIWLSSLRGVTRDIDDLLDRRVRSALEEDGSVDNENTAHGCMPSFYCIDGTSIVSRYKVIRRIKEIRERLDHLSEDKNVFGLSDSGNSSGVVMPVRIQCLTSSFIVELEIKGRPDDKEAVISWLVSGGSSDEVDGASVLAILGVRGVGKTTLAQHICHDPRVLGHFEMVLWVSVTDIFDVIRLTAAIIEEIKRTRATYSELDLLQNELVESLRCRCFLLVLDDVWNEDAEKWEMLRSPLTSGARGSRILATTRSEKVVNTMNAVYIHELEGLSDYDSWKLFSDRAFVGRTAEEHLQLESIGRQIASKCMGVPLSLKAIGNMVNSMKTVEDWQNVLDGKTGALPEFTPNNLTISKFIENVMSKLKDFLDQWHIPHEGANVELARVSDKFRSILYLLPDAEGKQYSDENVRVWLSRLRGVARDIVDLLDGWVRSAFEKNGSGDNENTAHGCVPSSYCFDGTSIVSLHKVRRRIKEIRERLDQIADDKNRFRLSGGGNFGGVVMPVRSRRRTISFIEDAEIKGRAYDKETVISRLVNGDSSDEVDETSVVAILGVGGVGKTTLAQYICHDPRVLGHFEMVLWVSVSDIFDVIRLLAAIIEEVKRTRASCSELNSLQNELVESLRGCHFLLVFDDVCNEVTEKWETLRSSLTSGAQGSRILVTTRSEKVANTMNAAYMHELGGLSGYYSWKLFSDGALAGRTAEEHLQLESVGRQIASKCMGVPLSLKAIGNMVNSMKTVEDWQNVLDGKTGALPEFTPNNLTISKLIENVMGKLNNVSEQRLIAGANKELEKLFYRFQSILPLLPDAVDRQFSEEGVRVWLSRLRGVTHNIDDLLDSWARSGLEKDGSGDNQNMVHGCVPSFYCFNGSSIVSRHMVRRRIKEMRERLDQIAHDKNRFCLNGGSIFGGVVLPVRSQRLMSSFTEEPEIKGRDYDKEAVISRLVSGSSSEEDDGGQVLHVVAIVGTAGLGKTTLARLIYNNARVRCHFHLAAWVCVSEVFDVIKLTKELLEEVSGAATYVYGLNSLQSELCRALSGKRFLLVLDDVWNDDKLKWDAFRVSLTSAAPGSRILVTTRREKAAISMGAACIYKLQALSDDDSWRLFSSRAFAGGNEKERLELEVIGRQIVNKLKGLPLLINVMADAMRSKRAVKDWQNVLDSETSSLPQVENVVLPAFALSYYNLPMHLKQCFEYFSLFQKDAVLVKDRLVKLWAAQGFIQLQENTEIEDIGVQYFDHIVSESILQDVGMSGKEIGYKLHDVFQYMAEFITRGEIYVGKLHQYLSNVSHASLFFTDDNNRIPISSYGLTRLRTLFVYGVDKIDTAADLFHQARSLRALCFSRSAISTLPKAIAEMQYLRYLDLSNLKIVELPESLSSLRNLQTLDLTCCRQLKKLPSGIGGMIGLRHLEIDFTDRLQCLPKGLGRIGSLKTLCKFIVGGEEGCGIDELQQLNSLRGTLKIQHLERVSSLEEAKRAELQSKPHIWRLVLEMSGSDEGTVMSRSYAEIAERMDSVVEGLQPHPNITELVIDCRHGSKLPSWIGDSAFSNLTKLEMRGFTKCVDLPTLGELPALEYLEIRNVGVKKVDHQFYYGKFNIEMIIEAFSKLKEICFSHMSDFEEWESRFRDEDSIMPALQALQLQCCPKLKELPNHVAEAPLKCLIIQECDRLGGTRCSFPLLEEFKLIRSSNFFSSRLPDLPKLQKFHIEKVSNKTLPDEGWEQLVALRSLHISQCYELKSLPGGLGQLRSLDQLTIEHCNKLESLPDELGQLLSLKQLVIEYCNKLKSLPAGLGQLKTVQALKINHLGALACLPDGLVQLMAVKTLKINNFESLICLPNGLGQLHSLEELIIEDCNELERLHDELVQLKALKSFKINHLEALICLPDGLGQLQSLKGLMIEDCNKLELLPEGLGQLQSLEELMIKDCNKLKLIPDGLGQLKALKSLTIAGSKALTCLPNGLGELEALKSLTIHRLEALTLLPNGLGQLQSLKTLIISSCEKLESLPNGLGQLNSLRLLDISRLDALNALPDSLGQLGSLKTLRISYCKKLESLPNCLQDLSLQELKIYDCPLLRERCKGEEGEDWPKVSHIPLIYIDNGRIQ